MPVYLVCKTQITVLIINKTPITILAEDSNFVNIFFKKSTIIIPKHIKINIYAINLEKNKRLPYKQIYSLKLLKLKILKIYIEINLGNKFI